MILLSPASVDSDWVKIEAGIAYAYDLPIAVVMLHVKLDDRPEPLKNLRAITMNEVDDYIEQLAKKAEDKR